MRCVRRRRSIPALACALTLALPSAALAQSAGDNQYQDPFSGQSPSSSQPKAPSGGGNSQVQAQAQASPAGSTTATQSQSSQSGQAAQGETLPRTGFEAFLPLAYGLVLLLSGAALRRGARSRLR